MCLEPPGMFNKVKITNVNKIGKTYLIIRGVLCTVIYGMNIPITLNTTRSTTTKSARFFLEKILVIII